MSLTRTAAVLLSSLEFVVSMAHAQPPSEASVAALGGSSWEFVVFRGGDGEVVKPDDGLKYTLAFGVTGQVTARFDCNRGRGTWKSSGPSRIEFGPLSLTRAFCGPESLHDRFVRQWDAIRSYTIKDGHLFLGLIADGGTFEFAPIAPGARK